MDSALAVHRLHFAFTVTFHYLFPQLTMGLALLIVILKTIALRTGNRAYDQSARFWVKIFAINFAMGVVTGIPMEFQFGTNWARFSKDAGGVIGQTLAMEGVFSFFLESTFLGLFVYGEKHLSPKLHWVTAFLVFLGSWLSGFFIIATDAWMQHPTGYKIGANDQILLDSFWGLILNPWILWQYLHNMIAAVVTASFGDGVGRRVLSAHGQVQRARAHLLANRRRRRRDRRGGDAVSNRRRPGTHGGRSSTGDARRHGRAFRYQRGRADRPPRPAGHRRYEARQSASGAEAL